MYKFFLWLICLFSVKANATPIVSKTRSHLVAYNPILGRGQHVDIKVTPPGARGADGKVLVEVYNRSKTHLALIQFDVTLKNRGGFAITAPVQAVDLNPKMSGSQWIKIPAIKGAFPQIDLAIVDNLKSVTGTATEIKLPGFVDLIKN
jgi:hypothetical protein